jgi:uncharacterized protein YbaA (DUF1428 family)
MVYADGFVIPIAKKDLRAYTAMAKQAGRIWREHGATDYVEAVGDDLKAPCGIPFPKLAKTKPSETVLFSFIVYRSRAHRDRVNGKVMADPRIQKMMTSKHPPFDVNRMSFGGFRGIVRVKGRAAR